MRNLILCHDLYHRTVRSGLPLLYDDKPPPTRLNMCPLKPMILAVSLTATLFGLASADRLTAPSAPIDNYPTDSLASRIHGLLAVPAAGRALALADEPTVQVFYARRSYLAAWCDGAEGSAKSQAALALLTRAGDYGLTPALYHAPQLKALADSLAQPAEAGQGARMARFDVLLTDGVVQFVRHLRRGQLHAYAPSPLEKAGEPFEPGAWVARALAAPDFATALLRCQPPQREYRELQLALAWWRRQPAGRNPSAHSRRALQMALTLERWRWAAIPEREYLLVNLPAYRLEVVSRGRVQLSQRIIIGRPGRPTPALNSRVTSFTIAPEWNVPRSVAVRHIHYFPLPPSLRPVPERCARAKAVCGLLPGAGRRLRTPGAPHAPGGLPAGARQHPRRVAHRGPMRS